VNLVNSAMKFSRMSCRIWPNFTYVIDWMYYTMWQSGPIGKTPSPTQFTDLAVIFALFKNIQKWQLIPLFFKLIHLSDLMPIKHKYTGTVQNNKFKFQTPLLLYQTTWWTGNTILSWI